MICDVDWDNHVLHVTKNLQKTTQGMFYIETPKTRESIRHLFSARSRGSVQKPVGVTKNYCRNRYKKI